MAYTSLNIMLTVDVRGLHNDPNNELKYCTISDNQGGRLDNPNNKATFDSIADSNTWVTWAGQDMGTGNLVIITDLQFENVPEGFFYKAPYQVSDDSWVAVLGENNSNHNMECKYTITFDDGVRGDHKFIIDPKLQIRKKLGANN
ncbi:hypothetical protein [Winogradskyella sp. 3972H.M.0a.05]|uniref:hypothetical protein n=1 Tax=Winogradskyella sp. 3972H.M.0a.05 TaxID=2950277 RepID=UPI003390975C